MRALVCLWPFTTSPCAVQEDLGPNLVPALQAQPGWPGVQDLVHQIRHRKPVVLGQSEVMDVFPIYVKNGRQPGQTKDGKKTVVLDYSSGWVRTTAAP